MSTVNKLLDAYVIGKIIKDDFIRRLREIGFSEEVVKIFEEWTMYEDGQTSLLTALLRPGTVEGWQPDDNISHAEEE